MLWWSGLRAPAEVGSGLSSISRGRRRLPGVATRSPAGELCAKEELGTTRRILLRFVGALTGVAGDLRALLLDDAGCSDVCQLQGHNAHKMLRKRLLKWKSLGIWKTYWPVWRASAPPNPRLRLL
jgi:hypothetical protein